MIDAQVNKRLGGFNMNANLNGSGLMLVTGQNGSGKTTLLKCLAGIYELDSGHITVNGEDVSSTNIERRRMVYISQEAYLGGLSVTDHLGWSGNRDKGQIETVRDRMGIHFNGRVNDLSMGQRMRVSIATAVLSSPRVILLDEVLANISSVDSTLDFLEEVSGTAGIDIIAVSQVGFDGDRFTSSWLMSEGFLSKQKD